MPYIILALFKVVIVMNTNRYEDSFSYSEVELYNQIVEMLYSAVDSDESIERALTKLKKLVYFDSAFFYIIERSSGGAKIQKILMPGIPKDMYQKYMEEYFPIDDTLGLVSNDQSIVYKSSDIFDKGYRTQTDFYKNFLEPVGIEYSLEETLALQSTICFGGLAIHRGRSYRDFNDKEIQFLKLLRPHLTRLAEQWQSHSQGSADDSQHRSQSLAKVKRVAYCIWDEQADLIEDNLCDRQFVTEEDITTIRHTIRGHILKLKKEQKGQIQKEMEHCFIIRVRNDLYYLDIIHYSVNETRKYSYVTLLYDFNTIFQSIIEYRCQRGSLTRREAEIVKLVIQGLSGNDIADRLSIESSTVKSHLNHVYSKLQIEGKHQLLQAIMGNDQDLQL